MKKNLKSLAILAVVACSYSCTNDSVNQLTEDVSLDDITYTNKVKSIINNNCISCHASTPINGAPMPLINYNQVKEAVENRGLLELISLDQGDPGLMPSGGTRLPQQSINIISQWAEEGFQE